MLYTSTLWRFPGKAMETFAKKHQDKVFRLALEDGPRFGGIMVAGLGLLFSSHFVHFVDFCLAQFDAICYNQSLSKM